MKRTISAVFKLLVALTLVAAGFLNALSGGSAPRITPEELKSMLGDSNLVIVDVRRNLDWDSSEYKIKGAVRADPAKVESWASSFGKDKTFVIY